MQPKKAKVRTAPRVAKITPSTARKRPGNDDPGPRKARRGIASHLIKAQVSQSIKRAEAREALEPKYVRDALRDIRLDFDKVDEQSYTQDADIGAIYDSDHDEADPATDLRQEINKLRGQQRFKRRWDYRDHAARLNANETNWQRIAPACAYALLQWRHSEHAKPPQAAGVGSPLDQVPDSLLDEGLEGATLQTFRISTIGFDGYLPLSEFWILSEERNVSLVRQGFIGTSAERPNLALCLKTLRIYIATRRHCPAFSIERFAKTLCSVNRILYTTTFRSQVSRAVDYYLEMDNLIEVNIQQELGLTDLTSRMRNMCPPCTYKVPGEERLKFSVILAMDGNESQRRSARHDTDRRRYNSPLYISEDVVETFSNETKASKKKKKDDASDAAVELERNEKTPAKIYDESYCTRNWTAAQPDAQKQMWATYDETGIFVLTCRHGHVLAMVDMIRSGEHTKYPLTLVSQAMEAFGNDIFLAYDIGCSFSAIAKASSLGPLIANNNLMFGVPAWHGWSHNRPCQLRYHPLYTEGTGLEDVEGCECVFSWTNGCARSIRHSTKYHRKQILDLTIQQWNEDKHRNLGKRKPEDSLQAGDVYVGNFIAKNYRQALDVISENSQALKALHQLGIINVDDLPKYLEAERAYISSKYEETPQETLEMEYMELLLRLSESQKLCTDAENNLLASTKPAEQKKLSTIVRDSINIYTKWVAAVAKFEAAAGIQVRWTEESPEWIETLKSLSTRRYRHALENLSRLLVQRLIELEKLGVGDTAYKLRKSLANALKRRSAALSAALTKFNKEAQLIGRPTLKFEDLLSYTFITDFELLHDTSDNVGQRPWATPAARNALHMWLKLQRAREEITRTKLEASRLRTWVVQDAQARRALIDQLEPTNKLLAAELRDRLALQELVNQCHLRALDRMDRHRNRQRDPWDAVLAARFRQDAPQEELIVMDPDSDVNMPLARDAPEQELITMEPDFDDDLPLGRMPQQALTGVNPDIEGNLPVEEDIGHMDIGLARDAATVLRLGRLQGIVGPENAEEYAGDSDVSDGLGSEGADLEVDEADEVDEDTGEGMVQLDTFLDKEDI